MGTEIPHSLLSLSTGVLITGLEYIEGCTQLPLTCVPGVVQSRLDYPVYL